MTEKAKWLSDFFILPVTCLVLTCCLCTISSVGANSHKHEYQHKQSHSITRHLSAPDGEAHKRDQIRSNQQPPHRRAFLDSAPGLYELDDIIRPLQGPVDFEKYVIHGDQQTSLTNQTDEFQNQFIPMVQYYMATCPDCQGFSPYFKRFISDIGPHWRHLVRVFVVNCNDDTNIELCWSQNPTLLVPLVRWYAFPKLLRNAQAGNQDSSFPQEYLNVSHRQYIEGERRDHISLRRASLRYLNTVVFHLNRHQNKTSSNKFDLELFQRLPIRWHLHMSLDMAAADSSLSSFQDTLRTLTGKCIEEANLSSFNQVAHFVIASDRSYNPISETVIADWSNWTCLPDVEPAVLIHYVNNPRHIDMVESVTGDELDFDENRFKEEGPSLFALKLGHKNSTKLKYTFLISRKMILRDKKSRANHVPKRLRRARQTSNGLSRRLPLEQYYNRKKVPGPSTFRYATSRGAEQAAKSNKGPADQLERTRRYANFTMKPRNEPETLNYAPPELYPDEELIRYQFNEAIYRLLHDKYNLSTVHAGFENTSFGRINITRPFDPNAIVDPAEEDLKHMTLTDYYKVLDDIVHKNMLAKAELDGYQLMTNICMLDTLVENFPFQGLDVRKSKSRFFLELVRTAYIKELNKYVDGKFRGCKDINFDEKLRESLVKLKLKSKDLSTIQTEESRKHNVGLPSESHFKWSYCAGSSPYLRGNTCSLWILFHTITVREYRTQILTNDRDEHQQRRAHSTTSRLTDEDLQRDPNEYEFKVEYSSNNTYCDPKNPDQALVSSSSEKLYVSAPRFAVANIINFVRFYLPCTNCAAHFSCMVHNSKLNFKDPKPGDHLLWLWEAHNRVNVRTRKTYSEDPVHPKHVFPDYGACPQCYIEKPSNDTEFTSMRFNRQKLIEFIVSRYQKSSILNNKIRIEDLFYKKPKAKS